MPKESFMEDCRIFGSMEKEAYRIKSNRKSQSWKKIYGRMGTDNS